MASLTVRSMLTEAVRLHSGGQLEQAARLYREALAADPNCADALHLLGMIALQQGRPQTAVELIVKAIARNDREASYHFHLALARQTLNDMEGAVAEYRRALALKPDDPDVYNNMGNALAALDRPAHAVAAFRRALGLQPGNAVLHNNLGNVQKSMGLWDEAEASFRTAAKLQPGYAGAFINLGNLCRDRGDLPAAESHYRHALTLAPRDAAALCGLGVTQWQLGRPDEALASYRAALAVDPDQPETLVNLGIARQQDGALEEAEALYARALVNRPRDPDILDHLASVRLARGNGTGAMEAIRQSLTIRETPRARKLFVELGRCFDGRADEEIRRLMVRALTEPWDRPAALAAGAARLIRSHPVLGPMVMRADAAWSFDDGGRLSLAELLGDAGFAPLAEDTLLIALLTSAPNTDIALERFMTMLRGAMIHELPDGAQAEQFAAALAQQCFINDYVFPAGKDELAAAHALAADIATPMQLLLTAAYRPLHSLADAEKLLARPWPAPVEAVLTQQLREPLRERRLRADIPRLTRIEDPVSRLVQDQYEENPYPRWVRPAPQRPDTIRNFLVGKFPFAKFERLAGGAQPDILIAGCGTGQRSIAMAQKFGGNMLAVDLSLASLGYARRKSEELGLTITYAQADILELERDLGGRQFDLIESLGVLHHLADPWAGWRALLSLLRPGGVMLLGLYSERARRPVMAARARIGGRGGSADDIRAFRQELIQSGDLPSILDSEDFFSLSACRDLLFHVQEQRMALGQVAQFLQSHSLRLLGFELDEAVLAAYRKRFPQDRAATDLACWEALEADHPGLFGGMYIFWVQKPSSSTEV